jgi:hypothetical protein
MAIPAMIRRSVTDVASWMSVTFFSHFGSPLLVFFYMLDLVLTGCLDSDQPGVVKPRHMGCLPCWSMIKQTMCHIFNTLILILKKIYDYVYCKKNRGKCSNFQQSHQAKPHFGD